MRARKWFGVLAIAAGVAVTVGLGSAAAGAGGHHSPDDGAAIDVYYDTVGAGPMFNQPVCTSGTNCVVPFTVSPVKLSGDIEGVATGTGGAGGDATHNAIVRVVIYEVTASPCGAGTFITEYAARNVSSVPGPDGVTYPTGEANYSRIVPGLGTGDLVGLTGIIVPVSSGPEPGHTSWHARINCGDQGNSD